MSEGTVLKLFSAEDVAIRTSQSSASPTKQHLVFSSSIRVSVNSSWGTLVERDDAGVGCVAGALRLCMGGWYVPKSNSSAFRCEENLWPAKGVVRKCGKRGLDEHICYLLASCVTRSEY
jgi:hypothetical protein